MAKITLSDVSNILGNPTSAANTINANNQIIEDAFEQILSRDGESPNQMTSDIDMNHNDIFNVDNVHANVLVLDGVTVIPSEVGALPATVMLKPTYDPQGKNADAFARANHTGTQDFDTTITGADLLVPSHLTTYIPSAPALVRANQDRWSIFAFSGGEAERAKADNLADYHLVFEAALSSGAKVFLPKWNYPIRSNTSATRIVSVTGDIPIDVECARGAKIIVGDEIDTLSAGLFSLQTSTLPSLTSQIPFSWTGGIFDGSQVSAATAPGIGMLDIFQYTGVNIRDVIFYAGTTTPSGSALGMGLTDTAIILHNCFGGVIDNCDFTGFLDLGVYISGNNDTGVYDNIGEHMVVQNSRFRRCQNGINMKRDHLGQHILNNYFYQCGNGILASPADVSTTNQGQTSYIAGNHLKFIQGRPITVITGTDYVISGNRVIDWGKWISDGATFTTVAAGNRCGGISGQNISFANISDNVIRMDAWAGGTAGANVEPVGIQLQDNVAAGSGGSFDNVVANNKIHNVHRTLLEFGAADRNYWLDNITTQPSSGTSLAHSISGANSTFIGQILTGSVTTDPASVAAGAGVTVTVPVTGAAIGDFVVGVSYSRDFVTTQLQDFDIHWAVTTGNVQIRLINNTAGALDLGNTIFTVQLRKAK